MEICSVYDPLSKRESTEWRRKGKAHPRKFRASQSKKIWICFKFGVLDQPINTKYKFVCEQKMFHLRELNYVFIKYIY